MILIYFTMNSNTNVSIKYIPFEFLDGEPIPLPIYHALLLYKNSLE